MLVHPEEHERVRQAFRKLLVARRHRLERVRCLDQSGNMLYCNWHTTAISNPAGRVQGMISLVEDVTERVHAEAELRQSRERLQLFVEGTPLGVVDWDRSLRIMGWNPAAERMFGYSKEEVNGQSGVILTTEPEWERMAYIWNELISHGTESSHRFFHRARDGRNLICDWYNAVLRDEDGLMIGITSLIEDVTDRVQAEEEIQVLNAGLEKRVAERTIELQQANTRLREVDRLKSEFLATMSHELRTPLNSIIGFSRTLQVGMAGPLNREQIAQMDHIHSAGQHLLALINDLLDLSKIEAGRMRLMRERFQPAKLLDELQQLMKPMVDAKPVELCLVNDAPEVVVETDRSRLFQVLVNLTNNAVKFTAKGNVTVRMHVAEQRLFFDVIDTGMGIAAENMGGLFEAFRQVDGSARRRYEGTGLGLYLCRKLIGILGGAIGVESELGLGSTFRFWIPLDASPELTVVETQSSQRS
jgi:PAS domain S-box-containing protein